MESHEVADFDILSNACKGVRLRIVLSANLGAIFTCEDAALHGVVGPVYQHNRDHHGGAYSYADGRDLSCGWAEAFVFELAGLATYGTAHCAANERSQRYQGDAPSAAYSGHGFYDCIGQTEIVS